MAKAFKQNLRVALLSTVFATSSMGISGTASAFDFGNLIDAATDSAKSVVTRGTDSATGTAVKDAKDASVRKTKEGVAFVGNKWTRLTVSNAGNKNFKVCEKAGGKKCDTHKDLAEHVLGSNDFGKASATLFKGASKDFQKCAKKAKISEAKCREPLLKKVTGKSNWRA